MSSARAAENPRLSLIDQVFLRTLGILIIGCGRLGSEIARQLVYYGFSQMIIVDHDVIERPNRGFDYPQRTRERFKVRELRRVLRYWSPRALVEPVIMRIDHESLPRLAELVSRVHAVICCFDDFVALQEIMPITYRANINLGGVIANNGDYAEWAWSVPDQTACISCALNASERRSESGAASLPLDVSAIANVGVRLLLGLLLHGRKGGELFQNLLVSPSHSLAVVHLRDNQFTRSSQDIVPLMTRLVEVNTSCTVCRRVEPNHLPKTI